LHSRRWMSGLNGSTSGGCTINLYMSHNNSYTSSIHYIAIPRHCCCSSTICTFVDFGYSCISSLLRKSSRLCSFRISFCGCVIYTYLAFLNYTVYQIPTICQPNHKDSRCHLNASRRGFSLALSSKEVAHEFSCGASAGTHNFTSTILRHRDSIAVKCSQP
jgi:hypothetical protein